MIAYLVLHGRLERDRAHAAIDAAPNLARVSVDDPARSKDQNAAMWAALDDISAQLEWHGMRYPSEEWKDYFAHSLKRAKWMPFEEGGMVPVGMSTSKLSHKDFSGLLDIIHEFGARHGVLFRNDEAGERAA